MSSAVSSAPSPEPAPAPTAAASNCCVRARSARNASRALRDARAFMASLYNRLMEIKYSSFFFTHNNRKEMEK